MEAILNLQQKQTLLENLKSLILQHSFEKELTLTKIESIGKEYQTYTKYSIEGLVSLQRRKELIELKNKVDDIVESEGYSSVETWKVEIGYLPGDKLPKISLLDLNGEEHELESNKKYDIINETENKIDSLNKNFIKQFEKNVKISHKKKIKENEIILDEINEDAAHFYNNKSEKAELEDKNHLNIIDETSSVNSGTKSNKINKDNDNYNSNIKLNIYHIWSMYDKNFNSELAYIELKNILKEISFAKSMKNSDSNVNLEDVFNSNNINQIMICADSQFDVFVEFIKHKNWSEFIPQFIQPNIFNTFCIKNSPTLIITDNRGIIKYSGNPFSIKLSDTIVKFYELEVEKSKNGPNNNELFKNNNQITMNISNHSNTIIEETTKYYTPIYNKIVNKTSNAWWNETDEETKLELVAEINGSLSDIDINDALFTVITQLIYHENEDSVYVIPIFTGKVKPDYMEYLESFAKDLSETLNFEDIKYDLEMDNTISHVNSFEFYNENENNEEKVTANKKEYAEKGV